MNNVMRAEHNTIYVVWHGDYRDDSRFFFLIAIWLQTKRAKRNVPRIIIDAVTKREKRIAHLYNSELRSFATPPPPFLRACRFRLPCCDRKNGILRLFKSAQRNCEMQFSSTHERKSGEKTSDSLRCDTNSIWMEITNHLKIMNQHESERAKHERSHEE